jgi:hypothetical protein
MIVEVTKICNKCKAEKALSAFNREHTRKDGRRYDCRECQKKAYKSRIVDSEIRYKKLIYQKEWRQTRRQQLKEHDREIVASKYGMTHEQYKAMLKNQAGVCAICRKPETKIFKGSLCLLCIDHDHVTGEVRGLLCNKCNIRLGVLENESFVSPALAYLKRSH